MRHEYRVDGPGFGLRPVALEDAGFIVEMRADAERTRHLNAVAPDLGRQQAWLEAYFKRDGDYYFVVERADGTCEGLVGLYGVDAAALHGEWGRWILRRGSMAAPASAMLVYEFAFGVLGLQRTYCRTLEANGSVVSFHDSSGAVRVGRIAHHLQDESGAWRAAIEHEITRESWPAVRSILAPIAERIGRRLGGAR